MKPEYVAGVITAMRTEQTYFATSAWGSKKDSNMFNIGMSLDFSIIDTIFAQTYGLFPIRYAEFVEKYGEIFSYQGGLVYPERVFALRFKQAIARAIQLPSEQVINQVALAHIHHITEREPIHHEIKKGKRKSDITNRLIKNVDPSQFAMGLYNFF